MNRLSYFLGVPLIGTIVLATSATSHAQNSFFTGTVVQDKAELRAGAGRTFYLVGELPRGSTVVVDEVIFGWYKIVPPNGCFSYIPKASVEKIGNDGSARVMVARVGAKSGAVTGSEDSYRRQIDLLQGDIVYILGEEAGYYKILPPPGAFVFLPPGSLQHADTTSPKPDAPTLNAPTTQNHLTQNQAQLIAQLEKVLDETVTETEPLAATKQPDPSSPSPESPSPAFDLGKTSLTMTGSSTDAVPDAYGPATPPNNQDQEDPQAIRLTSAGGLLPVVPADQGVKHFADYPSLEKTRNREHPSPSETQAPVTAPEGDPPVQPAINPTPTANEPAPTTSQPEPPKTSAPPQHGVTTPTVAIAKTASPVIQQPIAFAAVSAPGSVAKANDTTVIQTPHPTPATNTNARKYSANPAVSEAVRAAEFKMEQVENLPIDQQPTAQLLAAYESLWNTTSLTRIDRQIVAARIAQLRLNASVAAALAEIDSAQQEVGPTGSAAPPSSSRSLTETATPPAASPSQNTPEYTAMGRLLASGVYNGERLPRLFRIVDPASSRTLAYIKTNGRIDPTPNLGQYVGVIGRAKHDSTLQLDIIDIDRLDIIEPRPTN
jgi:hypothetical protein